MLSQNKYYFIPIVNVDGVAYIEDDHVKTNHTMDILEKRKNMALAKTNGDSGKECNGVKAGVDLNRNWGYDYKLDFANDREDEPGRYDPCSEFYAGTSAFSEKETQALRDFVTSNKDELRFVVNFHSNGNAFLFPFSSVYPNDIEHRAPKAFSVL